MDLSDGLSVDGHRLLGAAKLGAELEQARLPTSPQFAELCTRLELDPLDLMMHGGEDYVLLFCLPSDVRVPRRFGAAPIGTVVRDRGLHLVGPASATPRRIEAAGWDHLRSRSRS